MGFMLSVYDSHGCRCHLCKWSLAEEGLPGVQTEALINARQVLCHAIQLFIPEVRTNILVCLFLFLKTGFLPVATVVLELTLYTRLALNSEICRLLTKDTCEWENSVGRKDYCEWTKLWFGWALSMTHLISFPGHYRLLSILTHMELNCHPFLFGQISKAEQETQNWRHEKYFQDYQVASTCVWLPAKQNVRNYLEIREDELTGIRVSLTKLMNYVNRKAHLDNPRDSFFWKKILLHRRWTIQIKYSIMILWYSISWLFLEYLKR